MSETSKQRAFQEHYAKASANIRDVRYLPPAFDELIDELLASASTPMEHIKTWTMKAAALRRAELWEKADEAYAKADGIAHDADFYQLFWQIRLERALMEIHYSDNLRNTRLRLAWAIDRLDRHHPDANLSEALKALKKLDRRLSPKTPKRWLLLK